MSSMPKTSYRKQIAQNVILSKNKTEIFLDGKLVEDHFKNSDSINNIRYTQTIDEELKNKKKNLLEVVKDIIEFNLPIIEKQIIKKIYIDEMKQEGIGRLLNISQEMVSYYKTRAEKRIRYYIRTRDIGIQDMEEKLKGVVTNKQLKALVLYFKYHNQNIIAQKCNVTQSAISTRLKLGLKQIRNASKLDSELQKYYDIFQYLFLYNSLQNPQIKLYSEKK